MADGDKSALDVQTGTQVSAHRRRTAQARAAREARLAANLRANIARRKQQSRDRASGQDSGGEGLDAPDDDPAA